MPVVPINPTSGEKRCIGRRVRAKPGRLAEELGDNLPRRHALGERVAMPPVGAEDDIVRARWAQTPTATASCPM